MTVPSLCVELLDVTRETRQEDERPVEIADWVKAQVKCESLSAGLSLRDHWTITGPSLGHHCAIHHYAIAAPSITGCASLQNAAGPRVSQYLALDDRDLLTEVPPHHQHAECTIAPPSR